MPVILEGVKADSAHAERRGADSALSNRARRDVVYYKVLAETRVEKGDRRTSSRRRDRLASGKTLDENNRFVCECAILDRSGQGVKIKIARNIGLPPLFRLYDDLNDEIYVVTTVWRRGAILGLRYIRKLRDNEVKPSIKMRLRKQFYAILD